MSAAEQMVVNGAIDNLVATRGIEALRTLDLLIIDGNTCCLRCRTAISPARVELKLDRTCVGCQTVLEKLDPHSVKPPAAPGRRIYASSPHGLSFGDSPRSSRGRRLRAEGTALPY